VTVFFFSFNFQNSNRKRKKGVSIVNITTTPRTQRLLQAASLAFVYPVLQTFLLSHVIKYFPTKEINLKEKGTFKSKRPVYTRSQGLNANRVLSNSSDVWSLEQPNKKKKFPNSSDHTSLEQLKTMFPLFLREHEICP